MILTSIIDIIMLLLSWLVDLIMPIFFVSDTAGSFFQSGVFETLRDLLYMVDFFLPVPQLFFILIISNGVEMAIFGWRVLLRFKSFIPTMGN